jgi:hypothetical protein
VQCGIGVKGGALLRGPAGLAVYGEALCVGLLCRRQRTDWTAVLS